MKFLIFLINLVVLSLIVVIIIEYIRGGIERFFDIPNQKTSIGGNKGDYEGYPAYGIYPKQYNMLANGGPNLVDARPVIIDPSQVGFSYNSFVNRNTYADFYNNVGERRENPNFKFITRFKGLNLNPERYSLPSYSFASI